MRTMRCHSVRNAVKRVKQHTQGVIFPFNKQENNLKKIIKKRDYRFK